MSIEREGEERQLVIREFRFPNQYPPEQVEAEVRLVLGHRYDDPQFDFDPEAHMGTIWFLDVSFLSEKPRKPIEEMDDVELEIELLAGQRLEEY